MERVTKRSVASGTGEGSTGGRCSPLSGVSEGSIRIASFSSVVPHGGVSPGR